MQTVLVVILLTTYVYVCSTYSLVNGGRLYLDTKNDRQEVSGCFFYISSADLLWESISDESRRFYTDIQFRGYTITSKVVLNDKRVVNDDTTVSADSLMSRSCGYISITDLLMHMDFLIRGSTFIIAARIDIDYYVPFVTSHTDIVCSHELSITSRSGMCCSRRTSTDKTESVYCIGKYGQDIALIKSANSSITHYYYPHHSDTNRANVEHGYGGGSRNYKCLDYSSAFPTLPEYLVDVSNSDNVVFIRLHENSGNAYDSQGRYGNASSEKTRNVYKGQGPVVVYSASENCVHVIQTARVSDYSTVSYLVLGCCCLWFFFEAVLFFSEINSSTYNALLKAATGFAVFSVISSLCLDFLLYHRSEHVYYYYWFFIFIRCWYTFPITRFLITASVYYKSDVRQMDHSVMALCRLKECVLCIMLLAAYSSAQGFSDILVTILGLCSACLSLVSIQTDAINVSISVMGKREKDVYRKKNVWHQDITVSVKTLMFSCFILVDFLNVLVSSSFLSKNFAKTVVEDNINNTAITECILFINIVLLSCYTVARVIKY